MSLKETDIKQFQKHVLKMCDAMIGYEVAKINKTLLLFYKIPMFNAKCHTFHMNLFLHVLCNVCELSGRSKMQLSKVKLHQYSQKNGYS